MSYLLTTAVLSVQVPVTVVEAKSSALDKMFCRRLEVTGSRIGGRRVCMTKRE